MGPRDALHASLRVCVGGVRPSRIHSGDLGYSHMAIVWQGLYGVVCSGLGLVMAQGAAWCYSSIKLQGQ